MQDITTSSPKITIPRWLLALLPLVLLLLLVIAFLGLNPLSFFTGAFPPLEELTIQQVRFPDVGMIELDVINGGPDPVTIAQVLVDDAYWQYSVEPGNELGRLAQATIRLNYPWVQDEPLPITLITTTGVTFETVVFLGTLLSLGILLAVGQRRGQNSPLGIATLIALGIGLHNFGEGLAIGAAFATGAAALGSFLVVGFTLHNITEGVGIAAPLVREQHPRLITFAGLALLAGGPAILGTWVGSLAFSPFLATLFLSLGAGAILQVIWEVGKMLVRDAQQQGQGVLSWLNFGGLAAGILIMYLTAFLVKF